MELWWVLWSWEPLDERPLAWEPELGSRLRRSCRPIAVERRADSRLLLALGCWWPEDLAALQPERARERLDAAPGELLGEQVVTVVAPGQAGWPGRRRWRRAERSRRLTCAPGCRRRGAPRPSGASQRSSGSSRAGLGARAAAALQHPVLTYRLDFALPRDRVGAETPGWKRWRGRSNERVDELGASGWRVVRLGAAEGPPARPGSRWGTLAEVLADPDGAVDQLVRLLGGRGER